MKALSWRMMAGAQMPVLLGHDGGRMLLAEIAGEDLHAAELPLLLEMVNRLVDLQRQWSGRVQELLALGLPDWRAPALCAAITEVIARTREEIPAEDRATLAALCAPASQPVRRYKRDAASATRWSTATFIQAISAAMAGS